MNSSGLSFVGGDPIFQCQYLGYPPITFPSHESTLTLDGWKNGSMDLTYVYIPCSAVILIFDFSFFKFECSKNCFGVQRDKMFIAYLSKLCYFPVEI